MTFAHDTETALLAAAALANSVGPPDALATAEDLAAFYAEHGYTGRLVGDADELAAVQALRPDLRRLLTGTRDEAVEQLNAMLAEAQAVPRLVRHEGYDWHVHAVGPERPFAVRVAVETAMAMIDVVRADEMSRLGTCAADDCDGVVVDLSRNRSKRYCSTTCGNREAVAAYRARRAGD